MDVTGIANLASSMSETGLGQAVGIAVLKKALDGEVAVATLLIDALPAVSSVNLPAHLGQNINTTA